MEKTFKSLSSEELLCIDGGGAYSDFMKELWVGGGSTVGTLIGGAIGVGSSGSIKNAPVRGTAGAAAGAVTGGIIAAKVWDALH
ncbi:hypothetical protein ACFTQ7_10920 [Lysinibacillus sp. NPDC056959]|uniref:hypothetical protein n=1 Tax=Lysinibacillus sp. NPDC056959 TaxID=3345981 RepID=UPI0036404BDD